MSKRIGYLVAFAVPVLLLTSPSRAADLAPDPKAVNELWRAISACSGAKTYGIDEKRYQDYVGARDAAAKIDPKVTATTTEIHGMVPKTDLPKCEKLFSDYAAGVGQESSPVTDSCVHNTDFNMEPILRDAEKDYASKGKHKFIVWFQRKSLETARWYMFSKDGYQSMGARCSTPDPKKKAFKAIEAKFKRAEAVVAKLEAAKGIRFKGVRDGNFIVYVDAKTAVEVAHADRY